MTRCCGKLPLFKRKAAVFAAAAAVSLWSLPCTGWPYSNLRHSARVPENPVDPEDAIRVSVYQFAISSNPEEKHWFLAGDRIDGTDPDSSVMNFFAKDPRVKTYSEARFKASHLIDKTTGKPGMAMSVESILWKTKTEVEATLAFWNDDTGLARGPVYTLIKTKRGWVVEILKTEYKGAVA